MLLFISSSTPLPATTTTHLPEHITTTTHHRRSSQPSHSRTPTSSPPAPRSSSASSSLHPPPSPPFSSSMTPTDQSSSVGDEQARSLRSRADDEPLPPARRSGLPAGLRRLRVPRTAIPQPLAAYLFVAQGHRTGAAVGELLTVFLYAVDRFGNLTNPGAAANVTHNGTAGTAAPAGVHLNGNPAPQAGVAPVFGAAGDPRGMTRIQFAATPPRRSRS